MNGKADAATRLIGTHTFDDAIQQIFINESGDVNPIHADAGVAAHCLTGKRIVHGIHSVLLALEDWLALHELAPGRIQCEFHAPVSVGDTLSFTEKHAGNGLWQVRGMTGNTLCLTVKICTDASEAGIACTTGNAAYPHTIRARGSQRFPRLAARRGMATVNGLLACSSIVGMHAPGLYSLFAGLDLALSTTAATQDGDVGYRVDDIDERFDLWTITVNGAVQGTLQAFRRPGPWLAPLMHSVLPLVNPDEFRHCHALVIGGSRGIGACTSKALVAGGAGVTFTYCQSRAAAEAIQADIDSVAPGRCRHRPLDARQMPGNTREWLSGINAIFYFASGQITRSHHAADAGNPYLDLYVDSLQRWCDAIESQADGMVALFLPSSIFLDDNKPAFAEYIAAKQAAERLAQQVNAQYRHVRIYSYRLPAMATDQTLAPGARQPPPALETILPYLRDFCARIGQLR